MSLPLRIGAVAAVAGVEVQTLRYYERRGLLNARSRTSGGYREYSADAVRCVVLIRRAHAIGFTLDEIRVLLSRRVREHLTALQRMDEVLDQLIRACDARAVTEECPILAALEPEERT